MTQEKRVWTPEDDAFIRENFPFKASASVADMLGRTLAAVRRRASHLGVKKDQAAITLIWREAAKRSPNTGRFPAKHGCSGIERSPAYRTWLSMRQRCCYPGHKSYANYGGRGIRVCDRWQDFSAFLEDMGERPAGMSLDRYPNGDGNYEPGNCRWATICEQQRNRRSNVHLSHDGKTMTITEWSQVTGIHQDTIGYRIRNGWPIPETLTRPAHPSNRRTENREATH